MLNTIDATKFDHAAGESIGVIIANLGTPERPDKASVRRFLKQFLSDPRVVEAPRIPWWFVLNGIILNTRPKRSAAAYAKIWSENGSPLMDYSIRQVDALQQAVADQPIKIELAMRYGEPSIASALKRLQQRGANRILVLPLYPQYSATTTATIFDAVAEELKQWRRLPELRFVNHYHDYPAYIEALANSVRKHWQQHGRADRLLMSFHGIPQEYFDKGDPYFCECQKTARLLAERLGLGEDQWLLSFQSRLGPKQWLRPYTDQTLAKLAKQGERSVQVICPGFSVDCLETLEEIAMENKEVFIKAGGEQYQYIPCLNDSDDHIEMIKALVLQHVQGWESPSEGFEQRHQRASKLQAASITNDEL